MTGDDSFLTSEDVFARHSCPYRYVLTDNGSITPQVCVGDPLDVGGGHGGNTVGELQQPRQVGHDLAEAEPVALAAGSLAEPKMNWARVCFQRALYQLVSVGATWQAVPTSAPKRFQHEFRLDAMAYSRAHGEQIRVGGGAHGTARAGCQLRLHDVAVEPAGAKARAAAVPPRLLAPPRMLSSTSSGK